MAFDPKTASPEDSAFDPGTAKPLIDSGSFAEGLARAVAQGFYFGFADEVEASANAALAALKGGDFSETYKSSLEAIRGVRKKFSDENPATSLAAEVSGSIVTGTLGGLKLASKLPQAAGAISRGAVVGAPSGAAAGFGMADPDPSESFFDAMSDRVSGAISGGAFGAAGGAVGGAVAPIVGSGVEKTTAAIRGSFVGAKSKALRKIGQAMDRDAKSIQAMMRAKAVKGPKALLTDVGGSNTLDLLESIAHTPGRARDRVQRVLLRRLKDQRSRIKDAIKGLIHPEAGNLFAAREQIESRLRTQAKPFYDEAYRSQIAITPEIQDIINRPKIKPLLNKAIAMAKSDTDLDQGLADGLIADRPNVVLLDYLKRAIDDRSLKAKGNEQRIFKAASKKLRGLVDEQVPSYAQARAIFSSDARRLEALELGQSVFRDAKKGIDVQKEFDAMTPELKEMFRLGASNEMIHVIDNIADTIEGRPGASIISKTYSSDMQKRVVGMLMETPQAERNFKRMIESERSFIDSANKALGNSPTARRLAQQADLASDVAEGAELISSGGVLSGITKTLKRMASGKSMDEQTASELGRLITESDADAIRTILTNAKIQGSLLPKSINNALDTSNNRLAKFIRQNPRLVLDQISLTSGTISGGDEDK